MSEIKVTGRVTKLMKPEVIKSKDGKKEWNKQEFVINTNADYNPEICLTLFGDKVEEAKKLVLESPVECHINISSRPYKDKYYHSIDCWRIVNLDQGESQPSEKGFKPIGEEADLPF